MSDDGWRSDLTSRRLSDQFYSILTNHTIAYSRNDGYRPRPSEREQARASPV